MSHVFLQEHQGRLRLAKKVVILVLGAVVVGQVVCLAISVALARTTDCPFTNLPPYRNLG
jgi:hypothetical protein